MVGWLLCGEALLVRCESFYFFLPQVDTINHRGCQKYTVNTTVRATITSLISVGFEFEQVVQSVPMFLSFHHKQGQ